MSELAKITEAVFGDVPIRFGFSQKNQAPYVVAADLRKATGFTGSTNKFLDGLIKGRTSSSPLALTSDDAKGGSSIPPLYTGMETIETAGGRQQMRVIYKRGVFQLLMRSDMPAATQYRDRIFDLLETYERDGYVIAPTATPAQIQRMAERIAYMQIEDMIAGSFDYSSGSEQARELFSFIQNLIHRTITGHTAKELCSSREIVTWKGKQGPTKADRAIGKNYMTPSEAQRMKALDAMVIGVVKSLIDENGKYALDEVRSAVIKGVEVYKSLRS